MRSFVVCYPQRVRESSEQKTPCSLAPGCFGQIGRPGFQDSASCTNAAHIFGEPQLIKQMPLMVIFYFSAHLLSLPSRGAWIEMGSSCPGRSFWPICAPFRLSRGVALSGCPDGRAVPQPVGQGFPAASKAPAPKIWPNAAFCRPAACHFWEEAPDSGTGPAAERDAAAGCRHPKPAESLSSAPPSSRARRKSI